MTPWVALVLASLGGAPAVPFAGRPFPHLEGEYLSGERAEIPEDMRGSVALLALGFTDGARKSCAEWKTAFDELVAGSRGVVSFEVPMIAASNRLSRTLALTTLRRATPKRARSGVIAAFAPLEDWKRRVRFSAPNAAYAVLLDRGGVVRGVYSGLGPAARAAQVREAAKLARQLSRGDRSR